MRLYLGLGLITLLLTGAMGLLTGCGDAVANPTRWNLNKVVLSDEAVQASHRSDRNTVVLDFYGKDAAEPEFSREVEIAPGQSEIIVPEVPADTEYTVKGRLFCGDSEEAALTFDAACEEM